MWTDAFPNQETNMVARDPPSSSSVMILSSTKMKNEFMLEMRNKDYVNSNLSTGQATDQPRNSTSSTLDPVPNLVPTKLRIKPPRGVIRKSSFNTHVRAAQNYNIFEYLAQAPSTMLNLEVL